MQNIPQADRNIIARLANEGLKVSEIAERLGMDSDTVAEILIKAASKEEMPQDLSKKVDIETLSYEQKKTIWNEIKQAVDLLHSGFEQEDQDCSISVCLNTDESDPQKLHIELNGWTAATIDITEVDYGLIHEVAPNWLRNRVDEAVFCHNVFIEHFE